MQRIVNPDGLAWPDCWFTPGWRKHTPIAQGLAELDIEMNRFFLANSARPDEPKKKEPQDTHGDS